MKNELFKDKKIVFVVMDSLSAFNMGCYGHERDTTPFIDKLAENNIKFNYAYSNGPWTVPSHASIFSGELPDTHGTTSKNMQFGSGSFVEEIPFETLLMSHNPLVSKTLNFDKGFDEVWEGNDIVISSRYGESTAWDETDTESGFIEMSKDLVKNSIKHKEPLLPPRVGYNYLKNIKFRKGNRGGKMAQDEGGQDLVNLIVEETSDRDEFLVFANFLETHEYSATKSIFEETGWCDLEYEEAMSIAEKGGLLTDLTKKETKVLRDLYDMQVRYTDSLMKQLYQKVREEHPETVFIFTSDHGQNIDHYEHYTWDHQYGIWERLIRVPLIIAGERAENDTIGENLSLRNVARLFKENVKPRDITSQEVRSSYAGAKGFFFGESETLEDYEYWEKSYISNESKAVVKGRNIFVQNSKLKDFSFRAQKNRYIQKTDQEIDEGDYKSLLSSSDDGVSEKEEEVKEKLKDLGYL